ncbi:transcription factor HIVEP2, partial [Serendipita vermifera]
TSNRTMHTCTVCGFTTTRPDDLQRHELVHTNNRPFPCPKCGERFNRRDNARKH